MLMHGGMSDLSGNISILLWFPLNMLYGMGVGWGGTFSSRQERGNGEVEKWEPSPSTFFLNNKKKYVYVTEIDFWNLGA